MTFKGSAATAKALNNYNFACAILSAALLLMALPYQHATSRFKRGTSSTRPRDRHRSMTSARRRPRSLCFGLDHLLRIRSDQLAFYDELRAEYGDVVRLRLGPYRSWLLFHPAPPKRC